MTAPCLPTEVPDLRLRLVENWSNPAWQNAMLGQIERANRDVLGIDPAPGRADAVAAQAITAEQNMLRQAGLWWVGEEMCDLLYTAARTVPDDVTLAHVVPPSDFGLVVYAKPWIGTDAYVRPDSAMGSPSTTNPEVQEAWKAAGMGPGTVVIPPGPTHTLEIVAGIDHDDASAQVDQRGGPTENAVTINAMIWGWTTLPGFHRGEPSRIGLAISHYRLLDFEAGLDQRGLDLATGFGLAEARHGRMIQMPDGRVGWSLSGRFWVPLGRSDWPLDTGVEERAYDNEIDGIVLSAAEDRRLIATLWVLLGTHTAVEITEHHPDRSSRRRTERAKAKPGSVKLVYLRKPAREDEEHADPTGRKVNWSSRWWVSAHMRNQPCGPGRKDRRLVLVGPYVKGPPDLPISVKETVKVWIR